MWLVLILIIFAILLGGGGSPSPGAELTLQAVFVVIALAWVWAGSDPEASPGCDRLVLGLAGLVLALPAIQLVPLPPAVWHSLPGREDQVAALALVGAEDSWRPSAISPSRALAALLAMVPAAFCLFAVSRTTVDERKWIASLLAIMALLSAILGLFQLVPGGRVTPLYPTTHAGWVTGFQANRNAAADLLMIGLVALSLAGAGLLARARALSSRRLGDIRVRRLRILVGGCFLMILAAMLLTGSRAGIAILPVALIGCWAIFTASGGSGRFRPAHLVMAGLACAGAGWLVLSGETTLSRLTGRFAYLGSDARMEIWRDAWFALERSWPVGVGTGGFEPAMLAAERLEFLDASRPNRAHNDFLELAIEAGALGLLVLSASLSIVVAMAVRAWRAGEEMRPFVIFSATCLLVIGMHSIVDYPALLRRL